ncbi:hypothetical protein BB560_004598, partial [Smittium megazygosporum]
MIFKKIYPYQGWKFNYSSDVEHCLESENDDTYGHFPFKRTIGNDDRVRDDSSGFKISSLSDSVDCENTHPISDTAPNMQSNVGVENKQRGRIEFKHYLNSDTTKPIDLVEISLISEEKSTKNYHSSSNCSKAGIISENSVLDPRNTGYAVCKNKMLNILDRRIDFKNIKESYLHAERSGSKMKKNGFECFKLPKDKDCGNSPKTHFESFKDKKADLKSVELIIGNQKSKINIANFDFSCKKSFKKRTYQSEFFNNSHEKCLNGFCWNSESDHFYKKCRFSYARNIKGLGPYFCTGLGLENEKKYYHLDQDDGFVTINKGPELS